MKLALLLIAAACSMPSCYAQSNSSEPLIEGKLSDGVYVNSYFNFQLKLPPGWELAPQQIRDAVLAELNASAPHSDTRLLIMLLHHIEGAPIPDVIAVFSSQFAGRRDGAQDAVADFKHNRKKENLTDLIAPITTVRFGGLIFAREDDQLKGQMHFMANLARVRKAHLLSFQAHSATTQRFDEVLKTMHASVQFGRAAQ